MDRAYSLLTLKSVDSEKRVLTGIASTPTADRMGDEVMPKGAQFKLPLPFLWQHDSEQPIGQVTAATVTSKGIEVKVQLASIDEPGTLKDRLDEAWQSIKIGLVKGMSIGFNALEYAFTETGIKFVTWEWLELSAVTIAANAEASIQTIKSMDRQVLRAATGATQAEPVRLLPPAGVSATTTETTTTKGKQVTITEQITALEATRQAKAARMTEIMELAGKEGRTTDEAEAEEVDTLAKELKSFDADLVRLKTVESLKLERAAPVAGKTSEEASQARGGFATVRTPVRQEPGSEFAKMAICLLKAKGDVDKAAKFAKQHYGQLDRLNLAFKGMQEVGSVEEFANRMDPKVTKASVGAETTSDGTYGGPLVAYNQISTDFIEYLRPKTIIGQFGQNGVPALRRIPFNSHIRGQTTGGSAGWVGQGKAKPVTRFGFNDTYLGWTKLAAITVLTQELARFSDPAAEDLMRQSLSDVIVQRMDIDFIDPSNAGTSGVKPASITYGVTPTASSGAAAINVRTDLGALFAGPESANLDLGSAVIIMDMKTALRLSLQQTSLGGQQYPQMTMMGGKLDGIPVIVSNNLPAVTAGSYMILVFASEIYLADDGQVTVDMSTEASIEMSDAPTGASDTPTAVSVVSMFQTNSMALRAERYINWAKRRNSAVSIISGVAYGF